jgi:hypothetical protein
MKTYRAFVLLLSLGVSISTVAFADEVITNQAGQKILLKDDQTWEYINEEANNVEEEVNDEEEAVEEPVTEPTTVKLPAVDAKYAEEAVEVWDTQLFDEEVNYSDAVTLYLHYQNRTNKKVVGVVINVTITNPFGKTVFEHTYEDEVVLQPLERLRNDTYWYFEDNQFIGDEPYDRMWQMAQNGTAKIKTKVQKVIFEDGTILKTKPAVINKPVKK